MRIAIIPSVVALTFGFPAGAATCNGLGDLLAFIERQAGYPPPLDCPVITHSAQLAAAPALRSQVGAYVPATGQILLAPDLDTASVVGRSYLLHELVHAAQYQAGAETRVRCEGELEAEAYRIQTVWLRQQGEGREALLIGWVADALGHCDTAGPAMDY